MPDVVKILRGLHEAATAGPWFQWTRCGDVSSEPEDCILLQHCNVWGGRGIEGEPDCCEPRPGSRVDADCRLIATLRTLLPELIGVVEAAGGDPHEAPWIDAVIGHLIHGECRCDPSVGAVPCEVCAVKVLAKWRANLTAKLQALATAAAAGRRRCVVARCLRCNADSSWIEGRVPVRARDEEIRELRDDLAAERAALLELREAVREQMRLSSLPEIMENFKKVAALVGWPEGGRDV